MSATRFLEELEAGHGVDWRADPREFVAERAAVPA
jgi:hypothetical protein